MDTLNTRITAISALGELLSQFNAKGIAVKAHVPHGDQFLTILKRGIKDAHQQNGWYTQDNVTFALVHWSTQLSEANVQNWLSRYELTNQRLRDIAIIMAGNIPLVGFHDLLCVLLSGHRAIVKQSSKDTVLLPLLVKYLEEVSPIFKDKVVFAEEKLPPYDAVIATGSDNTARYFEYYFGDRPNIIRKNRSSVAVLSGKESRNELKGLAEDIFRYFGMGCRSVSKLYIPESYELDRFFEAIYSWHSVIENNKYANNYDYNKAVYLMSEYPILDNGFLLLKEDQHYGSPIGTLFYERYTDPSSLREKLSDDREKLQCVVASGFLEDEVPFGHTQLPLLQDYADGMDTMAFLMDL